MLLVLAIICFATRCLFHKVLLGTKDVASSTRRRTSSVRTRTRLCIWSSRIRISPPLSGFRFQASRTRPLRGFGFRFQSSRMRPFSGLGFGFRFQSSRTRPLNGWIRGGFVGTRPLNGWIRGGFVGTRPLNGWIRGGFVGTRPLNGWIRGGFVGTRPLHRWMRGGFGYRSQSSRTTGFRHQSSLFICIIIIRWLIHPILDFCLIIIRWLIHPFLDFHTRFLICNVMRTQDISGAPHRLTCSIHLHSSSTSSCGDKAACYNQLEGHGLCALYYRTTQGLIHLIAGRRMVLHDSTNCMHTTSAFANWHK